MSDVQRPHSELPSPERIAEYVEGAQKVLRDDLPAAHKLWKSWAFDLADNVLALARKLNGTQEQLEARDDLLRRLRQWDMLNPYYSGISTKLREPTADAPYWRGEIDRVLSSPQKEEA